MMKSHVKRTQVPGVLSGLGGFGGLFQPDVANVKEPVLVFGTDGVGTKLKIAFLMDKHDTVGQDCVAMCVNDIICAGRGPCFSWTTLRWARTCLKRWRRLSRAWRTAASRRLRADRRGDGGDAGLLSGR